MIEPSKEQSRDVSVEGGEKKSLSEDIGWQEWRRFSLDAQERFHQVLVKVSDQYPQLAERAILERVESAKGTAAWSWSAASEIQETINSVNGWAGRLHEWRAWNEVVESFECEEDKWSVLHYFVEPLAYFCMHQPSAVSERIMLLSETLLHQANCRVIPGYRDRLDQDGLKSWQSLRRSDRRKQVIRLGSYWRKFDLFIAAVDEINSSAYKKVSRNFRDLSVHSFAPRFMIGHVMRATRSVVPWQEMVRQPNGGFLLEDHPTLKAVQYEMVALEPFPLEVAYSENRSEYDKVKVAIDAFFELMYEVCDAMDSPLNK